VPFPSPIPQRRVEALAVLCTAAALYGHLGFAWSQFAIWFFLPDIGILGYLHSARVGGASYNLTHCALWPCLFGIVGFLGDVALARQIALIWAAHIAFDRALGWGLKYDRGFFDTDMGLKQPIALPFLDRQPR
jgi:hypothetical protein